MLNPESYIVQTEVKVIPGKIDDVLELFKTTNPKLVEDQSDWIKASFSVIEENHLVVVRAYWKNISSYKKFSQSDKFKETMDRFKEFFEAKPKITFSKVLFEM